MKRHVFLTGEIGIGKSFALQKTLALLEHVRAQGVQTYYEGPRDAQDRLLYLRAWGDEARGWLLGQLPGADPVRVQGVFDTVGAELLERARRDAQLIVIDECGRLERQASRYHEALRACLEGDTPVLCSIRKHKATWADWVRSHPAVTLLEVTADNRNEIPQLAASLLLKQIR